MQNFLSFLGVCGLTFVVLVVIARVAERFLCKGLRSFKDTHYITYVAMFSCIAAVLMFLEIPLFFAPSFYKIDLSELPVLICTFYLGPVAGVVTEMIKILLKLLLKGTSTAYVGDFANFAVGCSFILPASIIYHAKPGKKSALIGMLVGTLVMAIVGSSFNAFYLIPKYASMFGMPVDVIVGMGTKVNSHIVSVWTLVFYAVVPFNLLKGFVDSVLTFLLYKRLSPILQKGDTRKKAQKITEAE